MSLKENDLLQNVQLFIEVESHMVKLYQENNHLLKQSALQKEENHSIFTAHCIFRKQYLLTYVRPYENCNVDLQFKCLTSFVHPSLYANGVFVISDYNSTFFCEEIDDSMNDTIGENDEDLQYIEHVPNFIVELNRRVVCGSMFPVDEVCLGKVNESVLNNTSIVSMNGLLPITLKLARYFMEIHLRVSMQCKTKSLLLCHCSPERPQFIRNFILYPDLSNKPLMHILKIGSEEGVLYNSRAFLSFKGKETNYTALYDILGSQKFEKEFFSENVETDDETSLKVRFYWSGCDFPVSQHPPHSSKMVVQFQIVLGNVCSAANNIYLELKALDSAGNNDESLENSLSESLEDKLALFKENVSDFSHYGSVEIESIEGTEGTEDLETPMSQFIQRAFNRTDHDFTDKLWLFLYENNKSNEMFVIVEDVLQDVVDEILQPAISPHNSTKLAKFIRQMYLSDTVESKAYAKEKIAEFFSSEQDVFNLVREIGYEKLRKDYFHFFLSKQLTTLYELQTLCKSSVRNIEVLWKLHFCLEVVVTPSIYLNLTRDCQSLVLKAAIGYYSKNDACGCSPTFYLPLMPFREITPLIHQACETKHPTTWQCGYTKKNKVALSETTIYHVTKKVDFLSENVEEVNFIEQAIVLTEQSLFLPM